MDASIRRLASRSGAAIDLTPCGRVLLHVGPLALKLEPAALVAIHGLIGDAIGVMVERGLPLADVADGTPRGPAPIDATDGRPRAAAPSDPADVPPRGAAGHRAEDGDATGDLEWLDRILRRGRGLC